jgi:hypothetical protein
MDASFQSSFARVLMRIAAAALGSYTAIEMARDFWRGPWSAAQIIF